MRMEMVTMRGPAAVDVSHMNDIEAGLVYLRMMAAKYPKIKLGHLGFPAAPERMAGWWTDLKKSAGNDISAPFEWAGDKIGDAAGWIADKSGDATRLVFSDEVSGNISNLVSSYMSYGMSSGAYSGGDSGASGGSGNSAMSSIMGWLASLGSSFKKTGNLDASSAGNTGMMGLSTPLVLGGVGLVAVWFLATRRK